MPISKSVKKALRSAESKKEKNQILKTKIKKAIKRCSEKNLGETFSVIDKAAKRNIIHKNKAAHIKSRLSLKFATSAEKSKTKPLKNKSSKKS